MSVIVIDQNQVIEKCYIDIQIRAYKGIVRLNEEYFLFKYAWQISALKVDTVKWSIY